MIHVRKILFPTDFSQESNGALPYALQLAREYGAELHMLHVIVLHREDPYNPAHHFPDLEAARAQLQQKASEGLQAAVEQQPSEEITVRQVQRRDVSAGPAIVAYAEEEDVDLVVMSTHGRRGARHLLLGSVAEEVVRLAPCPVLSIPAGRREPGLVRQVLVPIDFSTHAERALATARHVAAAYGAGLQLLHVVEDVVHPAFYNWGAMSIKDLQPDIEERADKALHDLLTRQEGPEIPARFFTVEGHAARQIVHFAEAQGSDLIVIATHGLTGLEHFLLGGTAEKVVRRAPCPVLVLKAFKKSLLAG